MCKEQLMSIWGGGGYYFQTNEKEKVKIEPEILNYEETVRE